MIYINNYYRNPLSQELKTLTSRILVQYGRLLRQRRPKTRLNAILTLLYQLVEFQPRLKTHQAEYRK